MCHLPDTFDWSNLLSDNYKLSDDYKLCANYKSIFIGNYAQNNLKQVTFNQKDVLQNAHSNYVFQMLGKASVHT